MTTDRTVLRTRAYPDSGNLGARLSLYRYQRPAHDLPALVRDRVAGTEGAVLDVGCGTGRSVARLRAAWPGRPVVALDLSTGILADVPPPSVASDAARLPFRAGAFGAVLAMHMLYHVANVDDAVAEGARVLAPDGAYLVSTNAATDKAELTEVWQAAVADVIGGPAAGRVSFSRRFALEQAPGVLGGRFADVDVLPLRSVIEAPSAEPIIDYFRSYLPTLDLPAGTAEPVLDAVRHRVTDRIGREGAFRIGCSAGLLVCKGAKRN